MYSVQRLEKGTELKRIEVNVGVIKAIVTQTPSRVYAVVDSAGNIVKNDDGLFEIYPRKATALQVADWYNDK